LRQAYDYWQNQPDCYPRCFRHRRCEPFYRSISATVSPMGQSRTKSIVESALGVFSRIVLLTTLSVNLEKLLARSHNGLSKTPFIEMKNERPSGTRCFGSWIDRFCLTGRATVNRVSLGTNDYITQYGTFRSHAVQASIPSGLSVMSPLCAV